MTSFAGCHGVEVQPRSAGDAYGTTRESPWASLTLEDADIAHGIEHGAESLWSIPVVADDGSSQTHQMWRTADGGLSMTIADRPVLCLSPDRQTAVVGDVNEAIALQLVTTFALPLAAQRHGGFVVHASVAVRDGAAVVVCADSGTGKSSVLIALADAGWAPLTEDLVIVDLDATGGPTAWPGPPWVRVAPGQPGPAGARERFRTSDKIGWDLGGGRYDTCARVAHLVFLDPPHEEPTEQRVVPATEVIASLARHTPWFEDPSGRAAALFAPSVRLAGTIPATRIRLQRSDHWREEAVSRLSALRATQA